MSLSFKLGDHVIWWSQSQGTHTTKVGTIVAVVPAGKNPSKLAVDWPKYAKVGRTGFGVLDRQEESYLVSVVQGPKAKPKLYWPVVSGLKKLAK